MKLEIRSLNERLEPADHELIERRVLYALGRFGHRVQRVMVRLQDLNGPRGGLDKRCHIEARVAGHGVLVAEVRDVELEPAVSRAAERIARRVRDTLTIRRNAGQRGSPHRSRMPAA